jgi:hypothetical protein
VDVIVTPRGLYARAKKLRTRKKQAGRFIRAVRRARKRLWGRHDWASYPPFG